MSGLLRYHRGFLCAGSTVYNVDKPYIGKLMRLQHCSRRGLQRVIFP